jgi:hypothetical protein
MKVLSAVFALLMLSSCASYFKRQSCESTDWYKHGHQFAMSGQRLDSDPFLKECKQVEAMIDHAAVDKGFKAGMAAYCKEDVAYQKAFEGENYNYDFCESNKFTKLRASFDSGRRKLCSTGGYQFGAKGKKYAGQCSQLGEAAFLKNYNRGRRVYLNNEIRIAQDEIYSNNRKIQNLNYEVGRLNNQLMRLGSGNVIVKERKYDEFSNTYREEVRVEKDHSVQHEITSLKNRISSKNAEINSLRNKQSSLEERIRSFKRELATLEY